MEEKKKAKTPKVYLCNPYRSNNTCSKTGCFINGGECETTTHVAWALMPIPVDEFPCDGKHPGDQMINDVIYGFKEERNESS